MISLDFINDITYNKVNISVMPYITTYTKAVDKRNTQSSYTERLVLNMTERQKHLARVEAAHAGVSMNQFIRSALEEKIERSREEREPQAA